MMFGEAAVSNTTGKPEEEYIATYYPNAIEESGARSIDLAPARRCPVSIFPCEKPVYSGSAGKSAAVLSRSGICVSF